MGDMRLALVGSGWITGLHLRSLAALGRTVLVGVVSRARERAEAVTAAWGGTAYADLDEMLADAKPDVAYVCLPPHRAAAACESLVRRGIPFLTEKPLAATRADAERVGAALRGRRLVAAVGYQWRALDFLPLVRDRLRQRPARLVLGRWTGTLPPPPWWRHVAESGGQVVEQATHLYDVARFLVGEATVVSAVSAAAERAEHPDADVDVAAAAVLRFDNGAIGSFVNASTLASSQVELDLLADGQRTTIAILPGSGPPRWTLRLDDGSGEQTIGTQRDPYERQAERFLDAVVAGDPPAVLSTYDDALVTDRLVRSVVAAAGSRG